MSDAKKRRVSVSVLTVLAALFLGSVAVRLAGGTGMAIARELQAESQEVTSQTPPLARVEELALRQMFEDLTQREAALVERETYVNARLAELQEAEAALQQKLQELEQAENALSRTLSLAENASETDLTQLTTVYENMKPKEAAELFEEMDPEFAAGFFGRMRPEAAAAIMGGLSSQAAYSISAVMAGRHTDVPTQ